MEKKEENWYRVLAKIIAIYTYNVTFLLSVLYTRLMRSRIFAFARSLSRLEEDGTYTSTYTCGPVIRCGT